MKLAIMQPYFFPYIGYWQLLNVVDKFIILDDVTFIKQGYINRNKILSQNKPLQINLQISGISSNKLILDHEINNNPVWKRKLINTIQQNYRKAKHFKDAFPIIEEIILYPEINLSGFLYHQIKILSKYLNINTEIIKTSSIYKLKDIKGTQRIINLCKQEKAKTYINTIGGKELYNVEDFRKNGIELIFIKTNDLSYKQFKNEFVPDLSIIDVMMHNSVEEIKEMLNNYTLE